MERVDAQFTLFRLPIQCQDLSPALSFHWVKKQAPEYITIATPHAPPTLNINILNIPSISNRNKLFFTFLGKGYNY